MALRTSAWFAVVAAGLTGNTVSGILPGGSAAGAALQFEMLSAAAHDTDNNVSGLAAISPGGIGIVEASLGSLLALAGVPSSPAFVATLAYRLFSYWLPVLTGGPACLCTAIATGQPVGDPQDVNPAGSCLPVFALVSGCAAEFTEEAGLWIRSWRET